MRYQQTSLAFALCAFGTWTCGKPKTTQAQAEAFYANKLHDDDQKSCNAQGKFYNNDDYVCTDHLLATWACTIDGLTKRLADNNLKDPGQLADQNAFLSSVTTKIAQGFRIYQCGESSGPVMAGSPYTELDLILVNEAIVSNEATIEDMLVVYVPASVKAPDTTAPVEPAQSQQSPAPVPSQQNTQKDPAPAAPTQPPEQSPAPQPNEGSVSLFGHKLSLDGDTVPGGRSNNGCSEGGPQYLVDGTTGKCTAVTIGNTIGNLIVGQNFSITSVPQNMELYSGTAGVSAQGKTLFPDQLIISGVTYTCSDNFGYTQIFDPPVRQADGSLLNSKETTLYFLSSQNITTASTLDPAAILAVLFVDLNACKAFTGE